MKMKGTWHRTLQLAQSPKWQKFTGLGPAPEDRCSSTSWGPPFISPYLYNFTRSNPAYFDRKHKIGLYSLHS